MNLTIKQSNSFKKTVKKLPKQHKAILDDEVRKLINSPDLGERKKSDLDFLRVHKFKLLNHEVLLGYIYEEDEIIRPKLCFLDLLRRAQVYLNEQASSEHIKKHSLDGMSFFTSNKKVKQEPSSNFAFRLNGYRQYPC
jgi:mRNA-degrading endonuclease RelE of RelBE toxin-antitoxin system